MRRRGDEETSGAGNQLAKGAGYVKQRRSERRKPDLAETIWLAGIKQTIFINQRIVSMPAPLRSSGGEDQYAYLSKLSGNQTGA